MSEVLEVATVAPSEKPKTIWLPHGCKPSVALSKDETRPILCHAYLKRRDDGLWLYATDSFIAVALKVEGDAEEGYLPGGALRVLEHGRPIEQDAPGKWSRTFKRAGQRQDIAWTVDLGDYPDFDALGVFNTDDRTGPRQPVLLDPVLIKKVGRALGGSVLFDFGMPLKPVRVRGGNCQNPDGRRALIMPMRPNAS